MTVLDNNKIVIKIGGSVLHDENTIELLCNDIKQLTESGYKVILVHGGGKAINASLKIHGIQSEFIDGLRVTNADAMKIIEMVLCGQVNQSLVRKLNNKGLPAIGLSGADHHLLSCKKYSQQHGFVGEIQSVNTSLIRHILSHQSIPVIASIGIDTQGDPLNVNADMAACHIANALDVHQLIYLTDQDGIYDENGNVLPTLNAGALQTLINQGTVTDGMLIKTKAILTSLKSGLNKIHILNGNRKRVINDLLFTDIFSGTVCFNQG